MGVETDYKLAYMPINTTFAATIKRAGSKKRHSEAGKGRCSFKLKLS
jgi:hypothetical protein